MAVPRITELIHQLKKAVIDFGTCLSFDGSNDIVTYGTENPFSGSFYVSMWIKWNGINGGYQTLYAKRDSYAPDDLMLSASISPSGTFNIDTITSFIPFGYRFRERVWQHVVWVHDVANSLELLYVNGLLASSKSLGTLNTKTTALLSVGATEATPVDGFWGQIDKFIIGTIAPTANQVLLMAKHHSYPSQWVHSNYDEGSGSTATDSSGNGRDGTINGATYITDKVMGASRATITTRKFLPTEIQHSIAMLASNNYADTEIVPVVNQINIAFWYKPYNLAAERALVGWESTFDRNGFNFTIVSKRLRFVGSNAGAATNVLHTASTYALREGIWYHIGLTYGGNNVRMYINGVLIAGPQAGSITSNAGDMRIGARSFTNSGTPAGLIKDFTYKQSTTLFSTTNLLNLMRRNIIPSGAVQYRFNEDALDQNGANPMTLTGTTYEEIAKFQPRGLI